MSKTKVQSPKSKAAAPGTATVPVASDDHALLAVSLFRIGRHACDRSQGIEKPNPQWKRLTQCSVDGWLAVAKYIFDNYELKTAAGWKSVSVEMPDDEVSVLVYAPDDSEPVWIGYHDGADWRTPEALKMECKVTHWMHLPEPPQLATHHSSLATPKGIS